MKFNTLVVAAMVIASVNATWNSKVPGCLRGSCGSRPRLSRGVGETGSDTPQGPKIIEKGLASNPHMKGDSQELTCNAILLGLYDLQKDILELSCEFRYNRLSLYIIHSGATTLTDETIEASTASSFKVKAELETIEAEFAKFEAEYHRVWGQLEQNSCSAKYYNTMSPKELLKVHVLLNKQVMFPQV
ncbi:hypothetical protein BASA62_004432 [Batrachochytrium salamandrivorans]|nr:hypothetical protein BASA62_004432 [Batrachochytrium salamandrivorans]